jgi:hypothetical protein
MQRMHINAILFIHLYFSSGFGHWKWCVFLYGTILVKLHYFWFLAPICIALNRCVGEGTAKTAHCILYLFILA